MNLQKLSKKRAVVPQLIRKFQSYARKYRHVYYALMFDKPL